MWGTPAALRGDLGVDVEPVDVERLVAEPVGDFFSLDDEEALVRAVERVEAGHGGQEVVIGEDQEVVAMLAVPAHHLVRGGVAVRVERVRVGIAFVPALRRLGGADGGHMEDRHQRAADGGRSWWEESLAPDGDPASHLDGL
jgi:hypothetical protein